MVSAVITTYKRDPFFLERALQSVLNQTYKDIEIIVVDDSPCDFSERIAVKEMVLAYSEMFPERINYIEHEKNRGACAARNTGLRASKGEYIAFLDDDDEWLPQKTEMQLKKMNRCDIGLVYCDANVIYEQKNRVTRKNGHSYVGDVYDFLLCGNFVGSTSFPLIRKSALAEVNGFDETLKSSQDYDLWLRLSLNWKFDCVDEPLVNYYFHKGEQITYNSSNKLQGILAVYNKHKVHIDSNKLVYANFLRRFAKYYGLDGQGKKMLEYMFKIAKEDPFSVSKNVNCFIRAFYYYILRGKKWK